MTFLVSFSRGGEYRYMVQGGKAAWRRWWRAKLSPAWSRCGMLWGWRVGCRHVHPPNPAVYALSHSRAQHRVPTPFPQHARNSHMESGGCAAAHGAQAASLPGRCAPMSVLLSLSGVSIQTSQRNPLPQTPLCFRWMSCCAWSPSHWRTRPGWPSWRRSRAARGSGRSGPRQVIREEVANNKRPRKPKYYS